MRYAVQWLGWRTYDIYVWALCRATGHVWDYFNLGRERRQFRCCLRCERSEALD